MTDTEICRKCYNECGGDKARFVELTSLYTGTSTLWQAVDWCCYNWKFDL